MKIYRFDELKDNIEYFPVFSNGEVSTLCYVPCKDTMYMYANDECEGFKYPRSDYKGHTKWVKRSEYAKSQLDKVLGHTQKTIKTECPHINTTKTGFTTEYLVCTDCGKDLGNI